MASPNCVLVAVDIRSTHNVGSFFRTCDGLGVDALYLTGISPYPSGLAEDARLPHLAEKVTKDIHKTALGAETTLPWHYHPNAAHVLRTLKAEGWRLVALEQAPHSHDLTVIERPEKAALIVGNEVEGLSNDLLSLCDDIAEIPMMGKKESLNVSVAAAIGLFWLKNS
jgi:tRNA G18 (ribose-2'-O)-methylase SpoU